MMMTTEILLPVPGQWEYQHSDPHRQLRKGGYHTEEHLMGGLICQDPAVVLAVADDVAVSDQTLLVMVITLATALKKMPSDLSWQPALHLMVDSTTCHSHRSRSFQLMHVMLCYRLMNLMLSRWRCLAETDYDLPLLHFRLHCCCCYQETSLLLLYHYSLPDDCHHRRQSAATHTQSPAA
jgi:hypothetical protein